MSDRTVKMAEIMNSKISEMCSQIWSAPKNDFTKKSLTKEIYYEMMNKVWGLEKDYDFAVLERLIDGYGISFGMAVKVLKIIKEYQRLNPVPYLMQDQLEMGRNVT